MRLTSERRRKMALTKVTYTDDETVITAQNLNDIQDSIIELEDDDSVATLKYTVVSTF